MQDPLLNGFNKMRNGKRNETGNEQRFEGKQNKWILLIQLLTKEYDLKHNTQFSFYETPVCVIQTQ